MAQKVEVHLEEDLNGGLADNSIQFSLDGKDYEIDLSTTNAEKLRETLHPSEAFAGPSVHGRRQRLIEISVATRTPQRRCGPPAVTPRPRRSNP